MDSYQTSTSPKPLQFGVIIGLTLFFGLHLIWPRPVRSFRATSLVGKLDQAEDLTTADWAAIHQFQRDSGIPDSVQFRPCKRDDSNPNKLLGLWASDRIASQLIIEATDQNRDRSVVLASRTAIDFLRWIEKQQGTAEGLNQRPSPMALAESQQVVSMAWGEIQTFLSGQLDRKSASGEFPRLPNPEDAPDDLNEIAVIQPVSMQGNRDPALEYADEQIGNRYEFLVHEFLEAKRRLQSLQVLNFKEVPEIPVQENWIGALQVQVQSLPVTSSRLQFGTVFLVSICFGAIASWFAGSVHPLQMIQTSGDAERSLQLPMIGHLTESGKTKVKIFKSLKYRRRILIGAEQVCQWCLNIAVMWVLWSALSHSEFGASFRRNPWLAIAESFWRQSG